MTTPITVKGYVTALPRSGDEAQCRMAVIQDEQEYRILRRGAGVDLDGQLHALVEVTGVCAESEGIMRLQVRSYKVLDDVWPDDA